MEADRLHEGNIKALKEALELAINAENYELCADIRDQITEAEKNYLLNRVINRSIELPQINGASQGTANNEQKPD